MDKSLSIAYTIVVFTLDMRYLCLHLASNLNFTPDAIEMQNSLCLYSINVEYCKYEGDCNYSTRKD